MTKEHGAIVSDFDGTVTDNTKEAATYAYAYFEQMSELTGIGELELMEMVLRAEEEIKNNPGIYGWKVGELIVAPATADPYVFTTTTMQLIARQNGIVLNDDQWGAVHKNSYAKTGVSFKPEAKEYLVELQKTGRLTVVTNSHTDAVMKKIDALFGEHQIRVIGDARKHEINNDWEVVPLQSNYPGFPRPVNLRRRQYSNTLDTLGSVDWVVGDIYELDLALPEARGIGTVLVTADHTPQHELTHFDNHQRGFKSDNLLEILSRII
jgi:hypothetical protein